MLFFFLLTAWALAATSSVVVRFDAQQAGDLDAAWVVVVYPDGSTYSAEALDDGSDPVDQFAHDKLWVARLTLPVQGPAHLLLMNQEPGNDARILAGRDIVVGAGERQVQLRISEDAAAMVAGAVGVPAPEDPAYPIPDSTLAQPDTYGAGTWSRVLVMQMLSLLGALALVIGLAGRHLYRARSGVQPLALASDAAREGFWSRSAGWWALATSGVLTLVVWIAPLSRLTREFLGMEYVDHYGTQWFYWFVEYCTRKGISPSHTDMFFHPWGKDIYKHTGANVLDAYLAIPFRMLLGPIAGYNVFVVLGLVLSGVAFYWLARDWSQDRVACAVGALFYSLQPFILLEIEEGRPTQGITLFPVLFFLALLRSGSRRGWMAPVAAGGLLAITGYQYWFYALFGGLAGMAHGGWRFVFPPEGAGGRWRIMGRHVLMAGVAFVFVAPAALPMILLTASGNEVPGLLDTSLWSVFDSPPTTIEGLSIGIFSWQPLLRSLGFMVVDSSGHDRYLPQTIAFPWVFALVLVIYLRRPGKLNRGLFITMMVTLTLIAMGPVLLVGDLALPNMVYITLIKSVGFLRRLWWPSRSLVFIGMLMGLSLVVAAAWLRRQRVVWQWVGFSVLAVWWGSDLADMGLLPFPSWDARVPAGYRCLAQLDEGALIELPYAWTQAHLYYQTVHERPLLGGMLEDNATFTPPEFTAFRSDNRMIRQLLKGNPFEYPYDWDSAAAEEVRAKGYRYLVVQRDAYFNPDDDQGSLRLQALSTALSLVFGAPVYEDGRTILFSLWGEGPPCDVEHWDKDPGPIGPTEAQQPVREKALDRQVFHRWPARPESE